MKVKTITIGFNAVADLLARRVAAATAFWNWYVDVRGADLDTLRRFERRHAPDAGRKASGRFRVIPDKDEQIEIDVSLARVDQDDAVLAVDQRTLQNGSAGRRSSNQRN